MDLSNFAPCPSYQSQCFIVASVMEFMKIWTSRQGGSLHFDCQDGAVTIQFKTNMKLEGSPTKSNQTPQSRKKPSPSKVRRNKRRAEEYLTRKNECGEPDRPSSSSQSDEEDPPQPEPVPPNVSDFNQVEDDSVDTSESEIQVDNVEGKEPDLQSLLNEAPPWLRESLLETSKPDHSSPEETTLSPTPSHDPPKKTEMTPALKALLEQSKGKEVRKKKPDFNNKINQ